MGTFTETTADITVCVEPTPIPNESSPEQGIYAFAYAVSISNNSPDTVQLMERHWIIVSADEQIGEVAGPGVIGVQPMIEPGKSFEYTSSTVIRDPLGSMKGSYVFRRVTGGFFVVQIPRFQLSFPTLLH